MTDQLTTPQLAEIKSECLATPECHWSRIKLAMIDEIEEARRGVDLVRHLERQRSFSNDAFGPGARVEGILDHIRKELVEVEQAPDDLMEWIDVAMLALDGAWRSGASPPEIANALVAKLEKNMARTWPDWRDVSPYKAIEHNRSGDKEETGQ